MKQQEEEGEKKPTQVCNLQSKSIQQKDSSSENSGAQSIIFCREGGQTTATLVPLLLEVLFGSLGEAA